MAQSVVPSEGAEAPTSPELQAQPSSKFVTLTLGSIGVVYGDIGTSPLYAFREAVLAAGGGGASREAVYGVLSLILWALILIVTCKYVVVLLRADNNGEGGPLSLMALASRVSAHPTTILYLGVIGASLFFGDALITPSISVLSAIEGIRVATDVFDHYVVVATVVILVFLFAVQSRGTASVAGWFGPIMVVWFVVIGVGGLSHLLTNPQVLTAFNPVHGIEFLLHHGFIGFVTLGAVFLAVTGAEALYADLGHFGRKPIRTAWLGLVLPALALNYLGQAALVLADPAAIENPFFLLFPHWALIPMVGLATVATVIASQAVITGAFSLTRQAVQLGLLPRLEVRHTSAEHEGQIYLPLVNTLLLIGVLLLVGLFRFVERAGVRLWHRGHRHHGGHRVHGFPGDLESVEMVVVVGRRSDGAIPGRRHDFPDRQPDQDHRRRLGAARFRRRRCRSSCIPGTTERGFCLKRRGNSRRPSAPWLKCWEKKPPVRVPGTAVFLTSDPTSAPTALCTPQALQGAARQERRPHHSHDAHAACRARGTGENRTDRKDVFLRQPEVRLHGNAERSPCARHCPQAWLAVRHHVDVVLRVAPPAQARRPAGDAALAGPLFITLTRIANDATSYSRSRRGAWSRSGPRLRSKVQGFGQSTPREVA